MEVDNPDNPEDNSGSAPDSKSKGKRRLYVGSQALGFRRSHGGQFASLYRIAL